METTSGHAGANRRNSRRAETRETILAATKELVARKGPLGTTVRDITTASGANVAAVNYYFASKDELVELAAYEITRDINAERERRLDAYEAASGTAPLAPRDILRALIEPILYVSRAEDGSSLYVRIVYYKRTAAYAADEQRNYGRFDHTAQRFVSCIQRTFPHLSRADAAWHYEFARGCALHMLINLDPLWRRFELLLEGPEDPLPQDPAFALDQAAIDRVIDLLMAGFGGAGDAAHHRDTNPPR